MSNKAINWQHICDCITQKNKQRFSLISVEPVSGGCINSAYILKGEHSHYFIKLNQLHLLPMFEAEYCGLKEIAETKTIRVPQPILCRSIEDRAFIIMEMIPLSAGNSDAKSLLGQQLAALHQVSQPFFGWHRNNTIGSTKQMNPRSDKWSIFWRTERLDFQLSLASKNAFSSKLIKSGEKLSESLHLFFDSHHPHPSLLHGDLWSGNVAFTTSNEPVIYDPACYYGDRETDLAMTELFGGFGSHFYDAYNEYYPLPAEYQTRKILYNLYHILNHLNLFGSGYLQQAQNMIDYLLSELN